MNVLIWIIGGGVIMSAIAGIGAVTFVLKSSVLNKTISPLVAFSAGSLLGGAFLHMIPAALGNNVTGVTTYLWILSGFSLFFVLEQFLQWHHCHNKKNNSYKPLAYLILIGDGLHNFIGGIAISSTFLIDVKLGITTWLAAAAHEIPQELGDFGVLLHGGFSKGKALLFNILSGLTFLIGGVITFYASHAFDVSFLVPFAAGNFIYIGASDLVPEITRRENISENLIHFLSFISGIVLMLLIKLIFAD